MFQQHGLCLEVFVHCFKVDLDGRLAEKTMVKFWYDYLSKIKPQEISFQARLIVKRRI